MKTQRNIIIEDKDISPLKEELSSVLGADLDSIDAHTEEGVLIKKRYPKLTKLNDLLDREMMSELNTFNYERIKE